MRISTDAVCGCFRLRSTGLPTILAHMSTTTETGPTSFAKMAGSSIAGRSAAAWITDFLNAAYYRRRGRDVDDLRLAFCILTTYWYRKKPKRRLSLSDLGAFHSAFGDGALRRARVPRPRGAAARRVRAARRLVPRARTPTTAAARWGIAFANTIELESYNHDYRLKLARVGELTAESAPLDEQVWHTYPPVEMPSAEGVINALTHPETWPDYASEIGRFTPLRPGGLLGQTFEIEVAAGTRSGRPVFTRGYVTITSLVTPDDPRALHDWFAALEDGLARYGDDEPRDRCRKARSRWSASTSRPTRATSWAAGTTGCCSTRTRARRGCAPPVRGTRCRGTSRRPTRWPAATPSTRSGARAATRR